MVTFLSPIFHISVNSHIYIIIDKLFSVLLLRQELYMIGHRTKKSAYIYIYICIYVIYVHSLCIYVVYVHSLCICIYVSHLIFYIQKLFLMLIKLIFPIILKFNQGRKGKNTVFLKYNGSTGECVEVEGKTTDLNHLKIKTKSFKSC